MVNGRSYSGLLGVCVVVVILAGCSGSRSLAPLPGEKPALFPDHSAHQIQSSIIASVDSLAGYQATTKIKVRHPNENSSGTLRINQRRSDSLYASVHGPVGIEAAKALITPDSFFVYERFPKLYYYGENAYATSLLPTPISIEDLFANLTGTLYPDPNIEWQVTADTSFYYLVDPTHTLRYTIDPSIWRVTRYEVRSPDGSLIEERVFSEFDLFEGMYLPRLLYFARPQEESEITLDHRKLTINPDDLRFRFRPGRIRERILVGPE